MSRSNSSHHRGGRSANTERTRWAVLDQALAPFIPDSVRRLAAAAADSPGCGHRLASATALWARCLRRPPPGAMAATISDLPALLAAARRAVPRATEVEDCWLCDPRRVVRYAAGNQRYRVHPGQFTDPARVLGTVEVVANAIDEIVIEKLGFGVGDVLEVVLRHMDDVTTRLAPVWPDDAGERDRAAPDNEWLPDRVTRIAASPVRLTDAELSAVEVTTADRPSWLDSCSVPPRAAMALDWLTCPADRLRVDMSPDAAPLGPYLCVHSRGRRVLAPAALALCALTAATAKLASVAAHDKRAGARLAALTRLRTAALLGDAAANDVPDDGSILPDAAFAESIVIVRSPRHVVIVEMIAALTPRQLRAELSAAHTRLAVLDVGKIAEREPRVSPDVELVRVVVYGGPCQARLSAQRPISALHLTELDAIIDDAVAADDSTSVWHFLEDIAAGPILAVPGGDLLDVWRHWSHYGTFDPTCSDDAVALVDPTPTEDRWERSAEWEPIEAVATIAGLGSRSTWTRARLEAGGEASLTIGSDICLLAADPPLALLPHTDPDLSVIDLDSGLAVGVADSIRNILSNSPEVAEQFRRVGRPIVGRLEITAEPPDSASEDGICIRFAVHPTEPLFRLSLGTDWLQCLLNDPKSAHDALGEVLSYIPLKMDHTTNASFDSDPRTIACRASWQVAPVVALLDQGPVLKLRSNIPEPPRNKATRHRAARHLARHVREKRIAPGVYEGSAAIDLCRNSLTDAAHDALDAATRNWGPDALRIVLAELNAAHAHRAEAARRLQLGLTAPWAADVRRLALADDDEAKFTRPLQLIVEWLLTRSPQGTLTPDRHDIAVVADLAELVMRIGVIRSGATSRLHDAQVIVLETGLVAAVAASDADSPGIDLQAFHDAVRAHPLRVTDSYPSVSDGERDLFRVGDTDERFTPIAVLDLPRSLRSIDDILRRDLGTGVDGLIAVLASVSDVQVGGDGIALIDAAALSTSATEWSDLPQSEIDAAISYLTLRREAIVTEELRYWETERRHHRLVSRPLIAVEQGLLVAPFCTNITQRVLGDAFIDGRLPWPKSTMSKELIDALARHRDWIGRSLERDVAAIVSELGLPNRVGIEPHQAGAAGFHIPGEIDTLIADTRGRLWVFEVKDLGRSISPAAVRARVRDYTGEYFKRLEAKVRAVASAVPAVCALLGVSSDQSWEVRGVFVSRIVEAAAFLTPPEALFTVIDDVADLLRAVDVPQAGHFAIGDRAR